MIFIAALFAMALTYLWDSPFNIIPEQEADPTKILLVALLFLLHDYLLKT
jgi:hypothetical protein